jgi:hypothetical protein
MTQHFIFGSKIPARHLALVLAVQLAGPFAHGQGVPKAITISTIQGEGAIGRVQQRATLDPVVRVLDEKETPISGAAVVFTLPTEGATGGFGNGQKTVTIVTDREGIAAAHGLRFNQVPGKVPIHVSVSYKGLTARTNISQVSEAPAGYKPARGGGSGKVLAIVAVLAAGGAAGALFAAQKSGGSTPAANPAAPAAISLAPGAGTLAPPR